ncbi:MAG: hypothetical protein ACYS8K_07490 [Planctomycetota bacterium]|jgi:ribonuclease HII
MALWAGIDEAGYGPRLGPLVVAGTAFSVRGEPREGMLWEQLRDGVALQARGSDGRLVVNDSKKVYSPAQGLRRLEEGVLGFLHAGAGERLRCASDLLRLLGPADWEQEEPAPWFREAAGLALPLATNLSAVRSKGSVLRELLRRRGVRLLAVRAAVVFPAEFNRIVRRTANKSLLLFQKCGLVLGDLARLAGSGPALVLVDKHGARMRYRKLLLDVFPGCRCDILEEQSQRSTYRIGERGGKERTLVVTFQEGGDGRGLPTALASMIAKYVRELYMRAFNLYWQRRLQGLRPTAGYSRDARRFLQEITPVLHAEGVDPAALVRQR